MEKGQPGEGRRSAGASHGEGRRGYYPHYHILGWLITVGWWVIETFVR